MKFFAAARGAGENPLLRNIHEKKYFVCRILGNGRGFSFTDLLAIAVIISGLLFFIFPAVSGARDGSRRAACAENLRKLTTMTFNYMNDYEGAIYTEPGMTDGHTWNSLLRAEGYLGTSPLDAPRRARYTDPVLHCPSLKTREQKRLENQWWWWVSYAINVTKPHERGRIYSSGGWRGLSVLRLNKIDEPSNYWLFTDGALSREARLGWLVYEDWIQTHALTSEHLKNIRNKGIHIRHGGRTNMTFFDGSVDSVDADILRNAGPLPFEQGFDGDFNIVDF